MSSWIRSLPSTQTVTDIVATDYGVPVERSVLLRSFSNEVYGIEAAGERYAFKLYGHRRWSPADVAWEQELVTHLAAHQVTAAVPVPLTDGRLVGVLAAPEGPRAYALTTWVPGRKPSPPWTDGLYREFGALIARFHQAAASFSAPATRTAVDLEQSLTRVVETLADDHDHRDRVLRLGQRAADHLHSLRRTGLAEGIRHGDASLDNVHLTAAGVSLHDFDLSGRGFPVADLTGALATDHGAAVLEGYRGVKALDELEISALPWLRVEEVIVNLEFHLVTKPEILGTHTLDEGWVDAGFAALDQLARDLDR